MYLFYLAQTEKHFWSGCNVPLLPNPFVSVEVSTFFAGWLSTKESACQCSRWRRWGFDPLVVRSPGGENSNSLQYSCLDNSMDGGAWQATVHRITKNWTRLRDWAHAHTHIELSLTITPSPTRDCMTGIHSWNQPGVFAGLFVVGLCCFPSAEQLELKCTNSSKKTQYRFSDTPFISNLTHPKIAPCRYCVCSS